MPINKQFERLAIGSTALTSRVRRYRRLAHLLFYDLSRRSAVFIGDNPPRIFARTIRVMGKVSTASLLRRSMGHISVYKYIYIYDIDNRRRNYFGRISRYLIISRSGESYSSDIFTVLCPSQMDRDDVAPGVLVRIYDERSSRVALQIDRIRRKINTHIWFP